jgi:hypothetical protein
MLSARLNEMMWDLLPRRKQAGVLDQGPADLVELTYWACTDLGKKCHLGCYKVEFGPLNGN